MWYKEWFQDEHYRIVYGHRDGEEARRTVDLFEQTLRPSAGLRILDLACGGGRHALEFARRGHHVTGVDLSPALLEAATAAAREASLPALFRQGDMRHLDETESYDAVVSLFTSFGYFLEESENRSVVRSVAQALKPSGWFMLDFFNAAFVAGNFRPRDESVRDGNRIVQERTIEEGRINKTITIDAAEGERTFHESVRMYTERELRAMLEEQGLRIRHAFGDYDATPPGPGSPRVILFACKEAAQHGVYA